MADLNQVWRALVLAPGENNVIEVGFGRTQRGEVDSTWVNVSATYPQLPEIARGVHYPLDGFEVLHRRFEVAWLWGLAVWDEGQQQAVLSPVRYSHERLTVGRHHEQNVDV